mgnify:FL=1
MARHLINSKTGQIFDFTEILWKDRKNLSLLECDESGKLLKQEQPEIKSYGPIDPMTAFRTLNDAGIFTSIGVDPQDVEDAINELGKAPVPHNHPQVDPPDEPDVSQEVMEKLVEAIGRMKTQTAKCLTAKDRWWTAQGQPWQASLEKEAGVGEITPTMRNLAWEQFNVRKQ